MWWELNLTFIHLKSKATGGGVPFQDATFSKEVGDLEIVSGTEIDRSLLLHVCILQ